MIILDTDCLSLLNRENILESSILRKKLEQFSSDELFTTIITFEEQMRGWLTFIAKAKRLKNKYMLMKNFTEH